MKGEYKYVRLYNKNNNMPLYGIEVKMSPLSLFEVFLTEDDRETWFNDFLDNIEALGLEFSYNNDLACNENIYAMYEKAKTLKLKCGKVYIG